MRTWQTVRYIPSPNGLPPLRQQCGEFFIKQKALDRIPRLREVVQVPFPVNYRVEEFMDGRLVASFLYEKPMVAIPPETDRRKVHLKADDIFKDYD